MFLEALDGSRHETGFNGLNPRKTIELRDTPELQPTERYFGPDPESFTYVPYSNINVAPQMRTIFDPEELDNLATSINAAGLQNPLIVFEMSEELKDWYVNLCNEVWGGEADPGQYTKNENANYLVLVAGERRFRAINSIINTDEYDPENVFVTCQIRTCTSPLDMMSSQVAENIYNAPRGYQYATIIQEVYRLGLEAGLYETEDEYTKEYSPAGRQATKNALLFHKLPPYVRDYVARDELGYGHSLIFFDFYQAYQEKLDNMDIPGQEKQALMQGMLTSRLLKVVAEGWTKAQLESVMPGWIAELDYYQPGFFEEMFEDPDRDTARVEWEKIRNQNRELLNGASRALGRHNEALALANKVDQTMLQALQPNIIKQLKSAKALYETMAKAHAGKNLGDLAVETVVAVDELLALEETASTV